MNIPHNLTAHFVKRKHFGGLDVKARGHHHGVSVHEDFQDAWRERNNAKELKVTRRKAGLHDEYN